jgi:hypothetical protein
LGGSSARGAGRTAQQRQLLNKVIWAQEENASDWHASSHDDTVQTLSAWP